MSADEPRMMGWLRAHASEMPRGAADEHPDRDTLARHASGELSASRARDVSEHLVVCEDGRCLELVRAQAVSSDEVARMLYPEEEWSGAAPGARPRTFQARDMLWELMEELARERGMSIDDVVGEAMRAYAELRGHSERGEAMQRTLDSPSFDAPPPRHAAPRAPAGRPGLDPPHVARGARPRSGPPAALPPPPARAPSRAPEPRPRAMSAAPPPGPSYGAPGRGGYPAPPPPPRGAPPPAYAPPAYAPPPPARTRGRTPPPPLPPEPDDAPTSARFLFLNYMGDRVPVNRDRFVIGRSKAQADYRLDDPNVSRQHVMIERVADQFYVVDLGSTNGVAVNGVKVSRRALADGDVVRIGGHELVCELR